MPKTKNCSRCKENKELSEFFVWGRSKDGYDYHCKKCKNLFNNESYHRNKEKRLKKAREWAMSNRDKTRLASKKHRELHGDRVKFLARKRLIEKYGITVEKYKGILSSQKGQCAICRKEPTGKMLAIDHDHKCCKDKTSCGKCVRGLLCYKCNQLIGYANDSVKTLQSAVKYLSI